MCIPNLGDNRSNVKIKRLARLVHIIDFSSTEIFQMHLATDLYLVFPSLLQVVSSNEFELKFPKLSRAELKGFRAESSRAGSFQFAS